LTNRSYHRAQVRQNSRFSVLAGECIASIVGWLGSLSARGRYAPLVDVCGEEHLGAAASGGSGVLLATAHTASPRR